MNQMNTKTGNNECFKPPYLRHDRWIEYIRRTYASSINTMNKMNTKKGCITCFRSLKHRHDRWIEYIRST